MSIVYVSRPKGVRASHQDATGHEVLYGESCSGVLTLALETIDGHPVSPGTGRLGLEESGQTPVLKAIRRQDQPVIPGSGIKGACRSIYELLSASCIMYSQGRNTKCEDNDHCDACDLFGCMGLQGRLSFSDASTDDVEIQTQRVMPGFNLSNKHAAGEFRLYDGKRAAYTKDRGEPVGKISREFYKGRFLTRMWMRNMPESEVGRVLIAMGLDSELGSRHYFRLGGVKYDGFGMVKVLPESLKLITPERGAWGKEGTRNWCARIITETLQSDWARTFAPTLDSLEQILGEEGL